MQIAALLQATTLWLAAAAPVTAPITAPAPAPITAPPAAGVPPVPSATEPSSPPASSSSPPAPTRTPSGGPLTEAEAALRAGIHKKCVELAQQALATGQLDEDGVARAWWTRGRCHSIDGDKDRAERSYAVAVRVKPGMLMPVDDVAYERVKAEGTLPESALSLVARAAAVALPIARDAPAPSPPAPSPPATIVAVELAIVDDLGLGKTFLLVDGDGTEVARAPVERPAVEAGQGEAWVKPRHRFSGIPVEGLTAQLLDKHGNVLRRAVVVVDADARDALIAAGATPTTPAPSTTRTAAPITWLSYVGAGTALTGMITAAGTGIALAINTQQDSGDHVIDNELPLLFGFVGAVAVVVVGGVLVVVDQVPAG